MQTTVLNEGRGRAQGATLADIRISDVACALGFLVVLAGSVGPWVQAPLGSLSGFNGDGKITAGLAVLGMLTMVVRRAGPWVAAIVGLATLGLGVYEYEHIHHGLTALRGLILFGHHLSIGWSVGWGVYAVIGGALVAGFAAVATADKKG